MKSWTHWAHGLGSAAIGGAASAVSTMIVAPQSFNLHTGLRPLLEVALVSAIVTAAAYLKQSPLPPEES